jgi:hypothetical protein
VPELFDKLVKGGAEPLDAVRAVVTLLAGDVS